MIHPASHYVSRASAPVPVVRNVLRLTCHYCWSAGVWLRDRFVSYAPYYGNWDPEHPQAESRTRSV